jgi:hypothetical protein
MYANTPKFRTPEELAKYRDLLVGIGRPGTTQPIETIQEPAADAVYYTAQSPSGTPWATGFSGNRAKPDFNYTFRNVESRKRYIDSWLAGLQRVIDYRNQKKATRKAFVTSLKVGDILDGTWGYDQTNVEFVEVVEVHGNRVTIQELVCKVEDGTRVTPIPGKYTTAGPIIKVAQPGDMLSFKCYCLSKWNGNPVYQTDPYGGH